MHCNYTTLQKCNHNLCKIHWQQRTCQNLVSHGIQQQSNLLTDCRLVKKADASQGKWNMVIIRQDGQEAQKAKSYKLQTIEKRAWNHHEFRTSEFALTWRQLRQWSMKNSFSFSPCGLKSK